MQASREWYGNRHLEQPSHKKSRLSRLGLFNKSIEANYIQADYVISTDRVIAKNVNSAMSQDDEGTGGGIEGPEGPQGPPGPEGPEGPAV